MAIAVAAIAWPLLEDGGFEPHAQAVFIALAGAALLAAAVVAESAVVRLLRTGPVLCLGGLAAVGVASAAWTTISSQQTLRAALVVAGLAAMAVVGGFLVSRFGVWAVAGILAVAAGVSGLLGVWAVAHRVLPQAEWLGGAWRPGGPFEYPNTLALLEVCALVPFGRAASSRRLAVAVPASAGLAVAVAVLALAGSQGALALASILFAVALAWPRAVLGTSRGQALALCLCAVAAGMAAYLIAGGPTHRFKTGGDGERVAWLAVTIAAAAVAVPAALRASPSLPRLRVGRLGAAGVCLSLVLGLALLPAQQGAVTAGRADLLRAGVETAGDHPLLGAGAGSYPLASSGHQDDLGVHSLFAHDLPVESWAELGLLGLALTLALYALVGRLAWTSRGDPDSFLLLPCVVAFLLSNLVDWSWHEPAMGAVWALCLGGLLALSLRPASSHLGD